MVDSGESGRAMAGAEFLGQAYLLVLTGGLRATQRLAGVLAAHRATVAEVLGGSDPPTAGPPTADRRRQIDLLRGLARELGEAATQEARHLQAELDRLALALAAHAEADAAAAGGPHRYARAKP